MKQLNGNEQFEDSTFCYMKQLYRLAYARVGNKHDAEDIVQETYLKAYRAFSSIRDSSHIGSWLTKILLNTARDFRRRESKTVVTVDINSVLEDAVLASTQTGPEELLSRDELDPELLRVLKSMPETQLTTLILREIQDASYEEISSILKIPIGTVMSRLARARAFLRKNLSTRLDTPDDAFTRQRINKNEVQRNEV